MACKAREECKFSEKDVVYVQRLVYDVLVYTLPKCGFPETELPSTDYEENAYNRANFVEIAGLSALRVSLILRDKWKQMFLSRRKSSGFNKENIKRFLKHVTVCFFLSWTDMEQSVVESLLALCNEIIMFFHHEGIDLDLHIILNSICSCIIGVVSSHQNIPITIEELFGKFDIAEYTKWITSFISHFAIPYGSQDVSYPFFLYVRETLIDDLQKNSFPETISTTELRDYLGFLPDDLFTMITSEDFSHHRKNLASASKSILPSDHESSERQELPAGSEHGAVGGKSIQSANVSLETAQNEDSSKNSSELRIENDFGQMKLGSEETSQESHEVITKQKKAKKSKKSVKKASKAREECKFSEKDVVYVQRLVYDVLVYTLPKCGFPETELPSTDCEENAYNRANFVEIAGLSALRVSLILRDKWKQMFLSRLKSSGFNKENIKRFLKHVTVCFYLSWTDIEHSVVELLLGMCNEIIMFFLHEGIDIDIRIILNSIGNCIIGVVSTHQNIPKTIEELFGKFDNISEYTKWITDFISNFAIPYGSQDVSDNFFEYVRQKWKDLQMTGFSETLSVTEMRDYLGFLPDDMFAVIESENLVLDSKSILPSDHEPQKLSQSSESGAVGGKSTQPANVSAETAQSEGSSKNSSELRTENDLGKMSLGSEEASQESNEAIPKRKQSKKS